MSRRAESYLLLLPSLTGLGGGIELYLRQFLEALHEARPSAAITVVLAKELTLRRPELLSPSLRARLAVEGTGSVQRVVRIGEFVWRSTLAAKRARPTTIVCGHANFIMLSHLLARGSGAKLIALTYGVEAWNLARPLTVAAFRAAQRIFTISAFTASQLVRALDVPADRIGILHNAVDVARFTPGEPSSAVAEKLSKLARPRLITVCRLDASEAYKGVDTVTRVLARHPKLVGSYIVVGDGTDRPRLERLAAELMVPVTFFGRASDEELADLYRASDLFIMPSRKEGFGYVFIEAMACGLPVIAGSVDGSVDALAGGALGLLVNPWDLDEIAEAVRAQLSGKTPPAMRDPALLHAEVSRRFNADVFSAKLARLLP